MSGNQQFQAVLTSGGFRVQRIADGELIGDPHASRFRAQQAAADLDEVDNSARIFCKEDEAVVGGEERGKPELEGEARPRELRCPRCGSDQVDYERDSMLVAEAVELRDGVLVLADPPTQEWLDGVRLVCVKCGEEVAAEWTDERPQHVPDGQRPLHDGEALDELAAKLNEPGDWNGADVCELAAALLARTGRKIEDEPEDKGVRH